MWRIVVGIRTSELIFADARILVKEPACSAARQGERPWNAECDITEPAKRHKIATAAQRAGYNLEFERRGHRQTHPSRIALSTALTHGYCIRSAQSCCSATTVYVDMEIVPNDVRKGGRVCDGQRAASRRNRAIITSASLSLDLLA